MPDTSSSKIQAQRVGNSVKGRGFAFNQFRYFVATLHHLTHLQAKAIAAITENFAGRFISVNKGILVISQINTIIIGSKVQLLFAALSLLHNNTPEQLPAVITEYALLPLLHIKAASGVLIAVVINQRHAQCARRGAFAAPPAYLLHQLAHIAGLPAFEKQQLNSLIHKTPPKELLKPDRV